MAGAFLGNEQTGLSDVIDYEQTGLYSQGMSTPTPSPAVKSEGSARDRLLAAADELFYEEGVHTVGIDRVIQRAGVAKASLYSAFGSKEELVVAYLQGRAEERARRITQRIARHDGPRARILSVFDSLGERVAEPGFRGCAFVNASAEGPPGDSKVRRVCRGSREWLRGIFTGLAGDLGASDPALLGRQLVLIYDGAMMGASMDRDPAIARQGRAMAEALLDTAAPAPRRKSR
jgi:AcrR family transcriptional regulator